MRRSLVLTAALTLSCATARVSGGPESPVRLDTPDAVGWEPGGPFMLAVTIYNNSGRRLLIAQPVKDALQVKVFRTSDGKLACKTPPATGLAQPGWASRFLSAASGAKVELDAWPFCRNLPEGVYRYEAIFSLNGLDGVSTTYTGLLGPQGGRLAVGSGLADDEAALAAVLSSAEAEKAEDPSAPAKEAPSSSEPAPDKAAAAPAAASAPTVNPDAIRACVDRELVARGLNAYGDPQGTTYQDHPPVDEGGRVLYVASRSPEIRVACKIPGF